MQRNGRVNSGDVSIFYRAFGARGRTPILLMHGANYYDSYDWVAVAQKLATDREVATYDKRGFGESGWSPSKDYSVDANVGDTLAVIGALGWERPIVVGHSASGRLSIAFAANFPDKDSGFKSLQILRMRRAASSTSAIWSGTSSDSWCARPISSARPMCTWSPTMATPIPRCPPCSRCSGHASPS